MFRAFAKSEDGSATIESVLWLPFHFMFIILVVDATLLMVAETSMWGVASDTSRLVALRKMDVTEAKAFALGQTTDAHYSVDVSVAGNVVTTTIGRPFSDVTLGVMSLMSGNLGVTSTYRLEPNI